MHKTCSFLEKMQHRACIPQCLVLTSCVAPDSIWRLLSTEPCIEASRYAPCFSTLYPHMSYSACLCDVHGQTMPMLGCAAAFSLILPVHISDLLVHDRRRHTCTLSETQMSPLASLEVQTSTTSTTTTSQTLWLGSVLSYTALQIWTALRQSLLIPARSSVQHCDYVEYTPNTIYPHPFTQAASVPSPRLAGIYDLHITEDRCALFSGSYA